MLSLILVPRCSISGRVPEAGFWPSKAAGYVGHQQKKSNTSLDARVCGPSSLAGTMHKGRLDARNDPSPLPNPSPSPRFKDLCLALQHPEISSELRQ